MVNAFKYSGTGVANICCAVAVSMGVNGKESHHGYVSVDQYIGHDNGHFIFVAINQWSYYDGVQKMSTVEGGA